MTLGQCIADGEALFLSADVHFGQGTLTAWDEARWLALAALDLPIDSPMTVESRQLSDEQRGAVHGLFMRRIRERLPAAYLTKSAWLKGYRFHVDARVIIPRSFLGELLMRRFAPWIERPHEVRRVLDVCTGSGCLAIIAADQFREARVTASDLSSDALDVAAINVADHGMADRISLHRSDVFAQLASQTFDLIIANPPYVPPRKRAHLPDEFRKEPDMALIASDAGMAIVRRILQGASHVLGKRGLLAVEIGHEKKACQRLLTKEFGGMPVDWVRTAEQHDNVFVVSSAVLSQFPWRPCP